MGLQQIPKTHERQFPFLSNLNSGQKIEKTPLKKKLNIDITLVIKELKQKS
ncbi:hypothetical protein MASR2M44_26470 [Bacteroidota bacterium]